MSCTDLAVSFPARGVIRLSSHALFGDTDSSTCRRFIELVFQAEEISEVTITAGDSPCAELRYCPKTWTLQSVVNQVSSFLRTDPEANGHTAANGRIVPHPAECGPSGPSMAALSVARNGDGVVLYSRPAARSGWQV